MSAWIGARYPDCVATNTAGMAAYEQVAEAIRQGIRTGQQALAPGSKLPSHRQLAEQHGVALGTAQKAVKLLEDQGWLVARQSVGVFVANEPPSDGNTVTLADLRDRLATLQVEVAELKQRVNRVEDAQAPGD